MAGHGHGAPRRPDRRAPPGDRALGRARARCCRRRWRPWTSSASDEVVFTTTFVLAPFALAVAGHARATAASALVAVVLAIASGYWNDYAGSTDHLLRIAIVAAGGVAGHARRLGARARRPSSARGWRCSPPSASSPAPSASRTRSTASRRRSCPAAADVCWVDLERARRRARACSSTAATRRRRDDRARAAARRRHAARSSRCARHDDRHARPRPRRRPLRHRRPRVLRDPGRPRRAGAGQRPARHRPALHARAPGRHPRQRSPRR